jgi:hypothetical protein
LQTYWRDEVPSSEENSFAVLQVSWPPYFQSSCDVALLIFERNIFRRIYDPTYEDGEWKIRTNRELEELNKGENIVKWIKGQRVSWLGHLERMGEDRMPKKIFTQEQEGTRRRGRTRKEWREEVERDLQVLGVRRWRELVIGTNGEVLFDRPKPTAGCSANRRRRRRSVTSCGRGWSNGILCLKIFCRNMLQRYL